jgi:hypothetical protein
LTPEELMRLLRERRNRRGALVYTYNDSVPNGLLLIQYLVYCREEEQKKQHPFIYICM